VSELEALPLGDHGAVNELEVVAELFFVRPEQRLQHQVQQVLDHSRHHFFDKNTPAHVVVGEAQIRVAVHLQEPDAQVLVNQEVVPQELEAVFPLVPGDGLLAGEHGVDDQILDPGDDCAQVLVTGLLPQVLVELGEGQRVALLEQGVVAQRVLIAVVGEVDVVPGTWT